MKPLRSFWSSNSEHHVSTEELSCPMCCEIFKAPVLLSCSHVINSLYIADHATNTQQNPQF